MPFLILKAMLLEHRTHNPPYEALSAEKIDSFLGYNFYLVSFKDGDKIRLQKCISKDIILEGNSFTWLPLRDDWWHIKTIKNWN